MSSFKLQDFLNQFQQIIRTKSANILYDRFYEDEDEYITVYFDSSTKAHRKWFRLYGSNEQKNHPIEIAICSITNAVIIRGKRFFIRINKDDSIKINRNKATFKKPGLYSFFNDLVKLHVPKNTNA